LGIYSTLALFSLLLDPLPLKPTEGERSVFLPAGDILGPLLAGLWLWFVAWHTIQTNFLLKIAWVLTSIWLTVFAQAHPFRVEAERWAAKQPLRSRPTVTLSLV